MHFCGSGIFSDGKNLHLGHFFTEGGAFFRSEGLATLDHQTRSLFVPECPLAPLPLLFLLDALPPQPPLLPPETVTEDEEDSLLPPLPRLFFLWAAAADDALPLTSLGLEGRLL